MNYFKMEEFACPCCNENNISMELVELLDQARGIAEVPFKINSGFRCEKHNEAVGGSSRSLHKRGRAADIHVGDSIARYKILGALFKVGMPRVLIYKTFIHADIADEDVSKETCLWMA